MYKVFHGGGLHHGPFDTKVDEGNVGVGGGMTYGDGNSGTDVTDAISQGIGISFVMCGNPNDVSRLLGTFAERGRESMRPLARLLSVIHIDKLCRHILLHAVGRI